MARPRLVFRLMNRLSLRNNRLKFKIVGKLSIVLEEFVEYTPKENQRISTCNQFDLQTLGSQLVMPKNLLDHWTAGKLPISVEEYIEYTSI